VRKLYSLSGVVPIGAFLLLHILTTLSIVGSPNVYDDQVGFLHRGTFFGFVEIVLVLLPMVFHGVYGVARSFTPRDTAPGYDSPLMVTLQRVSGIVILVFIVLHTWEFRGQTWSHGLPVNAYSTKLISDLSSTQSGVPFIAFGYLVGIAASFFHLVTGMTSIASTWGFAKTPAAQRRARIFFRAAGSFFFLVSAMMVVQIATGVRYFPREIDRSTTACGTAVPTTASPESPSGSSSSPSSAASSGARAPLPNAPR